MRQASSASPSTSGWRRILWARQPFPDNYTSADFLHKLQSGPSGRLPTFYELVIFSLPLSQQLSRTSLFVACFLHLRHGHIDAEMLGASIGVGIVLCASTSINAFSTSSATDYQEQHPKRLAQPLSYALLALVILALSPLLRTLTEATTSDSIAALSTALFLLSFTLADYSSPNPSKLKQDDMSSPQLPATLSLNAAFCSSTVLASRLNNPIQTFSLMLASFFLFAFLPRWARRNIPSHPDSPRLPALYTVALIFASGLLLAPYSVTGAVANVLTAAFLSLICPAWMRRAQGWKVGRRGPWDVGIPRFSSR